jgi:hypothetical protein
MPEQEERLLVATPDEREAVWFQLGQEMGFKPETVEGVPGEASQFTAEDADDIPKPEQKWDEDRWA